MKGIYDEKYCSSKQIVLHYGEFKMNQVSNKGVMEMHPAKVIEVYQKLKAVPENKRI
jgi:hypothetical protein